MLARLEKHLYTDNAPETWHKNVRAYFLGRSKCMKPILDAIEARGDHKVSEDDFQRMCNNLMVDLEADQVSQEMWSWINLTLENPTSAERTLHNVPELNGAELYRRLVAPLGQVQPSVQRKNALRDKIQNPTKAKSMTTLMDAVADYEANMIDCVKAGGIEPSDEDQRGQLMKILPTLSMETGHRTQHTDCPRACCMDARK